MANHPYQCPKCGYRENAGGSDMEYWKKSPITLEGNPICPLCWNDFIRSCEAEMRCTVDWYGDGSDYEKHYGQSRTKVQITAEMVNKLRNETDEAMMVCKKALTESNGDFEVAKELLRTKKYNHGLIY